MTLTEIRAGLVDMLVTIPQVIAYGLIAFAPLGAAAIPQGLSSALLCAVVFGSITAAAGSSKRLVSGPRAITALLFAGTLQASISRGFAVEAAVLVGYTTVGMAGLYQVLFGLFRLGRLASFLPHPVLSGFVSASALLVVFSQIPIAIGLSAADFLEKGLNFWEVLRVPPLFISGLTVAIVLLSGKVTKKIPPSIVAITIGTAFYYLWRYWNPSDGAEILGEIKLMLPQTSTLSSLADWSFWAGAADIILLGGAAIALIASFDTILSTSALNKESGGAAQPNRDLVVHGFGNLLMALVSGLPGSGTLTRSIAIRDAGATRVWANVLTGIFTGVAMFTLADAIARIPLWVSAGMLVGTSIVAVDRRTVGEILRLISGKIAHPRLILGDLFVHLSIVVVSVAFNLLTAVGIGVVLAVFLFVSGLGRGLIRRAYTASTIHSRIQRPHEQLAVLQDTGAEICVIELQGALFFGSTNQIEAQTTAAMEAGAKLFIFDIKRLTSIDSSGVAAIRNLVFSLRKGGGDLFISYLEPEQRRQQAAAPEQGIERREQHSPLRWIWLQLHEYGLLKLISPGNCFADTDAALAEAEEWLLKKAAAKGLLAPSKFRMAQSIIQRLNSRQFRILKSFVRRKIYAAGAVILRQGDAGDSAFFLLEGRAEVTLSIKATARLYRVSTLVPGAVFGDMALMDHEIRSASVVALEPACCLEMTRQGFQTLCGEHPEIALILMQNLSFQFSERLRNANIMIAELES